MTTEMIGWGAALDEQDSDQLIVFISGYGRGEQATFHFAGFAEQFSQSKLFLRDHANCHYHKGIQGVSENDEENVEFLRYLIDRLGVKRVTFVSGSVGSHPAITWGYKLGVNDIHLVGPVTDINTAITSERAGQEAFAEIAAHCQSLLDANYPNLNLRDYMQANPGKVDCVDVYYGMDDPTDIQQAENINDLPEVRSTIYHNGNHFRVPMFVQRRDPDLANRINAKTVARPADLRKAGTFKDEELGYAVVRLVTRD